jgi:hypothetical protein
MIDPETLAALVRFRDTLREWTDGRDRELSSRIARLQRIVRYFPLHSPLREELASLRFDFECRRRQCVGDVYARIDAAERTIAEKRRGARRTAV